MAHTNNRREQFSKFDNCLSDRNIFRAVFNKATLNKGVKAIYGSYMVRILLFSAT